MQSISEPERSKLETDRRHVLSARMHVKILIEREFIGLNNYYSSKPPLWANPEKTTGQIDQILRAPIPAGRETSTAQPEKHSTAERGRLVDIYLEANLRKFGILREDVTAVRWSVRVPLVYSPKTSVKRALLQTFEVVTVTNTQSKYQITGRITTIVTRKYYQHLALKTVNKTLLM